MKFPLHFKVTFAVYMGAVALGLSSCEEDEKTLMPTYDTGVFISKAGLAGAANGSVDFYHRGLDSLEEDVFQKANTQELDGQVRAMVSAFDKTYLVTDSKKVEVVHTRTFTTAGVLPGLKGPQGFVVLNNRKGYVSDWASATDSGTVVAVDLNTLQITKTIKTSKTPGVLAIAGNRLFVASAHENKINVINTSTDKIDTTLTLGNTPNSMVVDGAGFLWVLAGRQANAPSPDTGAKGQLIRFSPNNLRNASRVFNFPEGSGQPHHLTLSATRNRLYFVSDGVYVMDIAAVTLPGIPVIRQVVQALGQDPTDGLLYTAKASANSASSWVVRYQNSGTAVDSFQVKGIPTGFIFR